MMNSSIPTNEDGEDECSDYWAQEEHPWFGVP